MAFLDALAEGLIDAADAEREPGALKDVLILTPNRRAGRELALALHRRLGRAFIAPSIRPLGEAADADDVALAFGPDALDLPSVYPASKRRGTLAMLAQAYHRHEGLGPLPPVSALAAADELADLIDQAAIAGGVDWSELIPVAEEIGPTLAEHWQKSATFLTIITEAWPKILAAEGAVDAAQRRLIAAQALAQRWEKSPPKHPVLIAGSTGSGAASRILMGAVLQLPRGAVVLPGVDPDLDGRGWKAVADAASHPQFVLRETLAALGREPADVTQWPDRAEAVAQRARRRLINEALAPAKATRGWNERLARLAEPGSARELVTSALEGLSLVEAEDEAEEALVAALLLRETLEHAGKTAALVTPEASLGRRVAAILERWGVDVAPSAGAPLTRVPGGALLLMLARWVMDPSHPVTLLAVLKHELVHIGRTAEELATLTSALELRALRGARRDFSLEAIAARLDRLAIRDLKPSAARDAGETEREDDRNRRLARAAVTQDASALLRQIHAILGLHASAFEGEAIDGARACEALARLAEALCAGSGEASGAHRLWSGAGGKAALGFLEQLAELSTSLGQVEAWAFADLAEAAAQRTIAPPDAPEHPRIAIWGPLEARLQHRDRMVLASLNEGAWPKAAPVDAFLNRTLRARLGLADPDERIGLSAHDFAQMANAPEVVLLRARRVDDKPAVASRWLWRLRTLSAGGLGDRASAEAALAPPHHMDALSWARAMRRADVTTPATQPEPKPPVANRGLSKFSPSRVSKLIRDPYSDYAQYILGLRAERRVGEEIDARERGTAVHAAIETMEKHGGDLGELIVSALIEAGASRELVELEKPLWLRAARVYQAWAATRAPIVQRAELEAKAAIVLDGPTGKVKLEAKADRVELLTDGTLAIIDFKTGQPKTPKQVVSGIEPQLALEAAIGARSAFGAIMPAPASELIYFQFSTSAGVMKEKNGQPLKMADADKNTLTPAEVAEQTVQGFLRLIGQYAQPDQPYLSQPRVIAASHASDYDRLARRAEWTVEEGEE